MVPEILFFGSIARKLNRIIEDWRSPVWINPLLFSSINSSLNINPGDIITSNTGFSFKVSSGTTVSISAINFYRSVASKFREQLDYVGISDEYAVEVTVMATSPGTSGNISRYDLARTTITGVSNVTNIRDFRGGTDQETDASFRDRVLSSFSVSYSTST